MSDIFEPHDRLRLDSHVQSMDDYRAKYDESINKPQVFWGKIAKQFYWKQPPEDMDKFLKYNFNVDEGPISIEWAPDSVTNICYNCLDRHVENGKGDQIAFHWEGNDPTDEGNITFKQLKEDVCKFANALKSKGVGKGDRVAIYMPMIVELAVAMLACARIGAVHSIVFGGYSADSLADRIVDGKCKLLVTADGVWRGDKLIHLFQVAHKAIEIAKKEHDHDVDANIVVLHLPRLTNADKDKAKYEKITEECWTAERDFWYHDLMKTASNDCEPEWLKGEDASFILYTSGSTGKPKGVMHTTAGYMLYAATTFKFSFDYHTDDIYWCTADIGWITGHTYVTYGPLLNGATSVIFEGTPFHPSSERLWQIVEKYKVSKFYTAPTAIRALMKFGEAFVDKYDLSSLKVLGTVGEPINPEAWLWYHKNVGSSKCSVVDTYWQTETGGHVMTPLPGCTPAKPGAACFPFFGVVPVILHPETGAELDGETEGLIAFKKPWPGIMRTVYGDHKRFESTYFKRFPGYYIPGDGAKRDADGYIWITGRVDDMLNCSGHLMSTAQVESALVEHAGVAEAAVVAAPHKVKGECLYCFVTTKEGVELTPDVIKELKALVREKIAPFATPDYVQDAPNLPKTRSGKIMRRVLRKIAHGDAELGDVSTMADASIIPELQAKRDALFNKSI